jgi:hypothetical protein
MVKKKVPDWLNSSLWSSTSTTTTTTSFSYSDTNHFDHHSSTSASPPIDPPLPPAATRDEQQHPPRHHHNYHPRKPDIKEDKHSKSSIVNDNISNNNSNNSISNNKIDNRKADNTESSAEDISNQALLLTEVSSSFSSFLPSPLKFLSFYLKLRCFADVVIKEGDKYGGIKEDSFSRDT